MPKRTLGPLLIFLSFSTPVVAQNRDNANSFATYHQECLSRTREQKLPPDVAKALCDCTLKTFRQRYSLPQFQELVRKSNGGDRRARETLTGVGESCFEKILYEE